MVGYRCTEKYVHVDIGAVICVAAEFNSYMHVQIYIETMYMYESQEYRVYMYIIHCIDIGTYYIMLQDIYIK